MEKYERNYSLTSFGLIVRQTRRFNFSMVSGPEENSIFKTVIYLEGNGLR